MADPAPSEPLLAALLLRLWTALVHILATLVAFISSRACDTAKDERIARDNQEIIPTGPSARIPGEGRGPAARKKRAKRSIFCCGSPLRIAAKRPRATSPVSRWRTRRSREVLHRIAGEVADALLRGRRKGLHHPLHAHRT